MAKRRSARPLRVDAQRNADKLTTAAVAVFTERGLGVPLEEVAAQAGVSIGTLFNRFGGRDGLIDAVVPDVAAAKLERAVRAAEAQPDEWARFARYVESVCELQATDRVLNDAVTRRFPGALRLAAVCDESFAYGRRFLLAARRAGSLRKDFTLEDLRLIIASNASLAGSETPHAWRRVLRYVLDGLRA